MKRALITGVAGQDGSYLAEQLLERGYEVHGIELPELSEHPEGLVNISGVRERINMYFGSVADSKFVSEVLSASQPHECYHLAAASFVSYAFEEEASILANNIESVHALLGGLKQLAPGCRLFFAGTSEMFGQVTAAPQDEATPYCPRSVYGISKVSGANLIDYYRNHHGLFACTGILYNHESIRRGLKFVTRKITATAAAIKLGFVDKLALGNLDAERDWGYAPDFTHAMWLMLQQETPRDLVLATGQRSTVRDFVDNAFSELDLDYRSYTEVSPEFYREKEAVPLLGDPTLAHEQLSWEPSTSFSEMVQKMVRHDLSCLKARGSFYS